jgi:hypothetical protein
MSITIFGKMRNFTLFHDIVQESNVGRNFFSVSFPICQSFRTVFENVRLLFLGVSRSINQTSAALNVRDDTGSGEITREGGGGSADQSIKHTQDL